jgi:uncharacterized SAM-binding protein YcdF (DUF218 family)
MIYVLKFFYSWVLPPACFVVVLAGLGWRLWRRSRRLSGVAWMVALLLYAASISPVSEWLLRGLEYRYAPAAVAGADGIVVLGGGTVRDVPTPAGWSGQLHDAAAQRLLAAYALHRQTGLPLLVSGGEVFTEYGREAVIMRDILVSFGVAPKNIILEDRSLNTTENARFTAPILRERGWRRPLMVTSAFHMPRSVAEFQRAGISVAPYPAGFYASRRYHWTLLDVVPSGSALRGTSIALKEYLGLAVLVMR